MKPLLDLKAGDEVAVRYRWGAAPRIARVERREKRGHGTLVVDGRRYNGKTGWARGDSFAGSWLAPVTDEVRAEIEHARLLTEFARIKSKELSTETLRAIVALVSAGGAA